MRVWRVAVLVLVFSCALAAGWSEGLSDAASGDGQALPGPEASATVSSEVPAGVADGALPEGLVADAERENPLARFEILAVGSLPVTLFYTNLGFDLYRFASNGFDTRYAPWPFNGSATSDMEDSERLWRLGTAALVSVCVAAADALIRILSVR